MTAEPPTLERWRQGAASAMERVNRLTEAQRQLHHALLRAFPRFGGPPPTAWLAHQARAVGLAPESVLAELAAHDVIQINPETGAIVVAYPFSGVPTAHQVRLAGATPVYAMCAIDALGIPFMLGADATVESVDPISGEAIRIVVRAGETVWSPPRACVVGGCIETAGPSATTRCPLINFFVSPTSAAAYLAAHPQVRGQLLDQAAAVQAGQRAFGLLLAATTGEACDESCCTGGGLSSVEGTNADRDQSI